MSTIAQALTEALAVTRRALAAESVDEASLAVQLRAPALEKAAAAKRAGASWGPRERQLARELMEADVQLIQTLWGCNAEAFDWLAGRDAGRVADMPHLQRLAMK